MTMKLSHEYNMLNHIVLHITIESIQTPVQYKNHTEMYCSNVSKDLSGNL